MFFFLATKCFPVSSYAFRPFFRLNGFVEDSVHVEDEQTQYFSSRKMDSSRENSKRGIEFSINELVD